MKRKSQPSGNYISLSELKRKILGNKWWDRNYKTDDYYFYYDLSGSKEYGHVIEENGLYYVEERYFFNLMGRKGNRINGLMEHGWNGGDGEMFSRVKNGIIICEKSFDWEIGTASLLVGELHRHDKKYGKEKCHIQITNRKSNGKCKWKWWDEKS